MTSSGSVRSAKYSNPQTPTRSNAESRVPPLRAGAQERPQSREDVYVDDSASLPASDSPNTVIHRSAGSGTHKTNGSAWTTTERRTERTRISIKSRQRTYAQDPGADTQVTEKKPTAPSSTVPSREKKEAPPPWNPQVILIPHTNAPLAARVSLPPLSYLLPESLEPPPLNTLSSNDQEYAILDDLLFVFMGYEGQYIRFVESYNPHIEKERLAGPAYRILPGLDPSLRDLTTSLLKMATYHSAVEAFVEVQSRDEFGAINHALCASIRKLLKDYLILIAQLEHQKISNPSFTLHVLHIHTLQTNQMMFQLYTLAQEMHRQNLILAEDLGGSAGDFDNEKILDLLREGRDLVPGSTPEVFKGGKVLRFLTERLSYVSGDPAARALLEMLLRDASRPYMAMLNEWLHHGGIKDAHTEFLIREQQSIRREILEEDYTDQYWEKRYTIRGMEASVVGKATRNSNDVPPQLEGVKEKVLLAGKYLNVVRECGGVDVSKEVRDVPKSFDDVRFLDNVNSAYAHANSSLLNLLLTTHALPARLRSLKHYFFLDRSDFFTFFLDLSESELKKPWKSVNVGKLQSFLDLALRQPGSVAAQDPFIEDVRVHMNSVGLTKFLMHVVNVQGSDEGSRDEIMAKLRTPTSQMYSEEEVNMTGFDSLEFKFSVPFPLSLVISSKTVLRYQIIFRYLLSMRHLEDLLVSAWKDHHKVLSWTNRSKNPKLEILKRRAWTLRSRMLVFVQQFTYYCTAEVIEPHWQTLMARVNGTDASSNDGSEKVLRTVDELMEDHVDFLDTCLKECMLMNSKLLRILSKITQVINLFASWTTLLTRQLFSADASIAGTPRALASLTVHFNPPTPSSKSTKPTTTIPPTITTTAPTTNTNIPPLPSISSSSSTRHPPTTIPDAFKTYDPTRQAKLDDFLTKYERSFNHHLQMLLDALDYYAAIETVALSRLCAHLSTAREVGGDKGGLDGGGIGGGGGAGGSFSVGGDGDGDSVGIGEGI